MTTIRLQGCTPRPLANYLKALATLRLVAEQADPNARGWWQGEFFALSSELNEEGLQTFFLERYQPTPIIAPWNGGSGFYYREGKTKNSDTGKNEKTGKRDQPTTATKTIDAIIENETPRFDTLRKCVLEAKRLLEQMELQESPKERDKKLELVSRLRSILPEEGLSPLDAAISLSVDNLLFPPLLGTGGTDGNLDFTNNFIQRLLDIFDSNNGKATGKAASFLRTSLFGSPTSDFSQDAIGMFSPGQAGGPNAGTGFEADATMNPWDFVLMIEGALLFAAATTRRFSGDTGSLSFPFTVRVSGAGSGAAAISDEAQARAEIWMPLWNQGASIGELKSLLSEGRSTVGKNPRPTKDGLDFARAVSQLAINRGIDAFERYVFLKRSGKAYLATPLGRYIVPSKPNADLIADLETGYWLYRFQSHARRGEAPARLRTLARRLDDALFDLTQRGNDPAPMVQKALIVLGEIQRYAATSPAWRESVLPIPKLGARWVIESRDETDEFQIACALAGLYVLDTKTPMPMRAHFAPETGDSSAWLSEGGNHAQCVWSHASLARNLSKVLQIRLLRKTQMGLSDKPLSSYFSCDIDAIGAYLAGETDDKRIEDLLAGLSLCHIRFIPHRQSDDRSTPPVAFGLLKLLFSSDAQLRRVRLIGSKDHLAAPLKLIRLLLAERGEQALQAGWRQLRIAGFTQVPRPRISGIDNTRLATALLIPVTDGALRQVSRSLLIEQVMDTEAS